MKYLVAELEQDSLIEALRQKHIRDDDSKALSLGSPEHGMCGELCVSWIFRLFSQNETPQERIDAIKDLDHASRLEALHQQFSAVKPTVSDINGDPRILVGQDGEQEKLIREARLMNLSLSSRGRLCGAQWRWPIFEIQQTATVNIGKAVVLDIAQEYGTAVHAVCLYRQPNGDIVRFFDPNLGEIECTTARSHNVLNKFQRHYEDEYGDLLFIDYYAFQLWR